MEKYRIIIFYSKKEKIKKRNIFETWNLWFWYQNANALPKTAECKNCNILKSSSPNIWYFHYDDRVYEMRGCGAVDVNVVDVVVVVTMRLLAL